MNGIRTPSAPAAGHMFSIAAPVPIISRPKPASDPLGTLAEVVALGAGRVRTARPGDGRPPPTYSSTVRESAQVLRGGTPKRTSTSCRSFTAGPVSARGAARHSTMPPMPEHDVGQPPVRPEVVQALFSALIDIDPDKLAPRRSGAGTPQPGRTRLVDVSYMSSGDPEELAGEIEKYRQQYPGWQI